MEQEPVAAEELDSFLEGIFVVLEDATDLTVLDENELANVEDLPLLGLRQVEIEIATQPFVFYV